jgi:hypothetical protein
MFLSILLATLTLGSTSKPLTLPVRPVEVIAAFRPVDTCETMTQPEPIDSPHPLMRGQSVARVDFILGYNGGVYSPFFLVSYNINEREVMKVIKTWKFHPMMCNGVPVDSEAQITLIRQ